MRDDTTHTPDEDWSPPLTRLSNVWSGGLGPTAMALYPSGHSLAVANYQSGIASLLHLDGSGVLSSVTATTPMLSLPTALFYAAIPVAGAIMIAYALADIAGRTLPARSSGGSA